VTAAPAQVHDVAEARCYRITAGDTVRLAVLRGPDELDPSSVSLEIWDPGGAQPPNSHPRSVETFLFLRGEGMAVSDGVEHPVRAGQLLVLAPGSVHRIVNTGDSRLYAITTMTPDDGFVDLIAGGVPDVLDADDLAVLQR
jgi:mannose-6-phosphate isomerase-like protein (cupin superfamily)